MRTPAKKGSTQDCAHKTKHENMTDIKLDGEDVVLVSWSGKYIFLRRHQLDEWYDHSYEDHVYFVKTHPWLKVVNPRKRAKEAMEERAKTEEKETKFQKQERWPEQSEDVVVHWSGKTLRLKRAQLDEWYNTSFEKRVDYFERHPSCEILGH